MDKRDRRRMALCVKMAEPRINTQRTKFVTFEQPEIRIATITEDSRFGYDTIRLEKFIWQHKEITYCLRWAYHEKSDTVFYWNWQKYILMDWGEWRLISTLN
jgi:hypothetical protein